MFDPTGISGEDLGFEHLKEMYIDDPDFKEAYKACVNLLLRDRS
jgi:hypothetical protein